jgi:hypothetical protein
MGWLSAYVSTASPFFLWTTSVFAFYYYNQVIRKRITTAPTTVSSETEKYSHRYLTRLRDSYAIEDPKWNANIDSAFSDKKSLAAALVHEKNDLETTWRRRILFETTPRGNIVMFYDPYKLGFSYYSDASSIPYSVLNSAAIKYCLNFACREFLLDDETTPEDSPSSFISIHIKDSTVKTVKNDDKQVFAKFKQYSSAQKTSSGKKIKNPEEKEKEKEVRKYNRNRFICLGKMANMQVLQKTNMNMSKTNSVNGFKSSLLDNLAGETALQKQVMSYQDFKRQSMASSA